MINENENKRFEEFYKESKKTYATNDEAYKYNIKK